MVQRQVATTMIYPKALPITDRKGDIIEAIRRNRVVIISGETGSGKTTQIPKMCLEAGQGRSGLIGCTQPRRIAAITVARRIAEEMGEVVGQSVGYKIRFEEKSGPAPCIKIMTDGILLMEAQRDPWLSSYDTIIVDEAHERSSNIDFVLGILKTLLQKRRNLKVVITSATIDTEKFSRAFHHAPVIEVSGRMYPVEVRYQPIDQDSDTDEGITYVDAAVQAVETLSNDYHSGDILIFMPTEQDILETCELLEGRFGRDAAVLPMFARLSWTEQQRVFQPAPVQKIIVATNVAETSITIPGIRYVIDTGLARILEYNPRLRTTGLPVKDISKSSADQRKGRCGRVQDGICIRLYSQENYEGRPQFTPPEILRTNLAEIILRMISLKLGQVEDFPFIDPPPPKAIRNGIDILQELGAIRLENKNGAEKSSSFTLTERGRLMARLPLDPRLSRMIIEAREEGCLEEVKIVAAALSTKDPRERPAGKEAQADSMQGSFRDPASDFMTMLSIWRRYEHVMKKAASKNQVRKFCREHYLSSRRMREWRDVHEQITTILKEQRFKEKPEKTLQRHPKELYAAIHRSILSGYLSNIAQKKEKNIYAATKGREAMIFPGSALFNRGASWIVAAEMIETSRLFARMTAGIESEWLEVLGGNLCRLTYSAPRWEENRGEVVADEQVTLFGLVIIPQRRTSYGRIDPEESSRIFIRSALIEGRVKKPLPFLAHNRELVERVEAMEDKLRRRNLLVTEDMMAQFYAEHLPGIYDVRTLQKLILDRGSDQFLRMREDDVIFSPPDEGELALYPDEIALGRFRFRCAYRFDPAKPDDGLTLKIPVNMLSTVPAASVDWLVPGLLREKIAALIKGLPKEHRKRLQPIAGTCEIIMDEMADRDIPLLSALGKFIGERFGVDIPASAWPSDSLGDHLRMRLAVVDGKDKELASSRDIHDLKNEALASGESHAFKTLQSRWEKTGLTAWDFGDLPEHLPLKNHGHIEGVAFPALADHGESVAIRLFKVEREALLSHLKGVRILYAIRFRDELRHLKKGLILTGEIKTWAAEFAGIKAFEHILLEKVHHDLFDRNIRTKDEFIRHGDTVRPLILTAGQKALHMAGPILKAHDDTVSVFRGQEKANRLNKPVQQFLSTLRMALGNLLPANFLELYDEDRLTHIIRYLKALTIRAQRGVIHLDKDISKSQELKPFLEWYRETATNLPMTATDEKRRDIDEFHWMLEEYKVSLFAQELKTAFPISRKRLQDKMRAIGRIV